MDDLILRLVIVGGAALAVAIYALVARRFRTRTRRRIASTGLTPGTYLFTSAGCEECARARQLLDQRVGVGGYSEIAWESEPRVFDRLGVRAVPSTLVVAEDGSGLWHAGVPGNP
ncbi:MAG TPA: hypothetical protein VF246_05600 [Acidimicrobiia bacterium]